MGVTWIGKFVICIIIAIQFYIKEYPGEDLSPIIGYYPEERKSGKIFLEMQVFEVLNIAIYLCLVSEVLNKIQHLKTAFPFEPETQAIRLRKFH